MRRGADYIAGIKGDGRTVLLDGEAVDDVTTHPGFAGPTRVIASLYDAALDNPDIAYEADGARHNAMWLPPANAEDLGRRHRAHRHWADGSFGLMGRTPDHVASIITAFAARRDVFDRAGDRISATTSPRSTSVPATTTGSCRTRSRHRRSTDPSRLTSSPSPSSIREWSRSATTGSSSAERR